MFNILYEMLPVLLFFIAFKWFGIYVATVVGIVATFLQVVLSFIFTKKLVKQQLITLVVFTVFGGLTLYFHNPIFIKFKPTIIFWIFALAFLLSHKVGNKLLIQRILEPALDNQIAFTRQAWSKLNLLWTLFFFSLGLVNLIIAQTMSLDAWVNFKFYGVFAALLIFGFLQAFYLSYRMGGSSNKP